MLLEFNVDLLIESNLGKQLNAAMNLVSEKRTEYQQVPRFYRDDDFGDKNPYRFELVKVQLEKMNTNHEKKAFLLRVKTDYFYYEYTLNINS